LEGKHIHEIHSSHSRFIEARNFWILSHMCVWGGEVRAHARVRVCVCVCVWDLFEYSDGHTIMKNHCTRDFNVELCFYANRSN